MKLKTVYSIFTLSLVALMAIVSLSACGGGGGGGGGGLGTGSIDSPAKMSINTTYYNVKISATMPMNFYYFNTGGAGLYEISLTDSSADVAWDLYDAPGFATFPIMYCDNSGLSGDEVCTVTLEANTTYYLEVLNWDFYWGDDAIVDLSVTGPVTIPGAPVVSAPEPADSAAVTKGASGQLLRVYAPGATSGTFHYDDDDAISWDVAATVNGDYLEATIPYVSGEMNDSGTNWWYVEATNLGGTTRYPVSGLMSFTVISASPVVSAPEPADTDTVAVGLTGQLLRVYAPGADSGTFHYDVDNASIDYSVTAVVNSGYLEATIPYTAGQMTDNGTNYWYVEATNIFGTTTYPATGELSFTVDPNIVVISAPEPADGDTVAVGASGQVLRVYAPGATSGTFYYDDDDLISFSVAAAASGDYLEVNIPYVSGAMTDNGTNYWYVEGTNASGTVRYPATGQMSFTVSPFVAVPVVSTPTPADGATVTAQVTGQVLKVLAPGSQSGVFYFGPSASTAYSAAATVNGDYIEVTIPYEAGKMTYDGLNYWFVNATNSEGTTRYPASGELSFTAVLPADDHGDDYTTASVVSQTSNTGGVLIPAGESDFFEVTLAAQGYMEIFSGGSTNTVGTLYDSGMTELASAESGAIGSNFAITNTLGAGTYYVEVAAAVAGEIGSYSLTLQYDDYGNSIANALTVGSISNTAGAIDYGGDSDYFEVVVASAGTLELTTTGMDTVGTLYDSGGTELQSNDNDGFEYNFFISQAVTAGTYYVQVRGFGSSTAGYVLEVNLY